MDAMDFQRERDFVEKGNLLDSRGEFQQALAAYNNALAIDPSDADAIFNKATTMVKLGQAMEAQKLFEAAVAMYTGAI